jgi:hypothetical protein
MLPTKFRLIWPNGYRRKEFLKSANQKQRIRTKADFKNSSPLKLFDQMYQNLVGSINGKSSVAIAYVVLIR